MHNPWGSKFFQFHEVFRKIWQNRMLVCPLPLEGWHPHLGEILDPPHTADTEFSVTNFFLFTFSEHAQWGLPVVSDILVKTFVDISCNICGLFLL